MRYLSRLVHKQFIISYDFFNVFSFKLQGCINSRFYIRWKYFLHVFLFFFQMFISRPCVFYCTSLHRIFLFLMHFIMEMHILTHRNKNQKQNWVKHSHTFSHVKCECRDDVNKWYQPPLSLWIPGLEKYTMLNLYFLRLNLKFQFNS